MSAAADIAAIRREVELLNAVVEKLEGRMERAEGLTVRTLSLVNRLSGSDELSVLINKIQDTMQLSQQLIVTLEALQMLRMSMGDPLAWFQFGVSSLGLGVTAMNVMEIRRPRY